MVNIFVKMSQFGNVIHQKRNGKSIAPQVGNLKLTLFLFITAKNSSNRGKNIPLQ